MLDTGGTTIKHIVKQAVKMDGTCLLYTSVMSGETSSIVAAAKDDGIFILTPSGSAKNCIEGNDNAFRLCFNDPQQGTASADFISENDLAKKVAVFYQSDLDYSVGLYETFKLSLIHI